MRVLWLPEVLRAAGLKVAVQPGWEGRGREFAASPRGIICHHTAGPARGNAPSLGIVTNGRSDLPGPLSQLVLGRDGTYYVVASGRANHAGRGSWKGITDGNGQMLGIEAEATGRDAWPDVQMDAYRRGVAAILARLGRSSDFACGHKEYALPAGRKPDPNFDMAAFRRSLSTPPPPPPAPVPPKPPEPEDPPMFAIAYTPTGNGYYVLLPDGGIGNYGDATPGLSTYGAEAPGVKATGIAACPLGGIAVVYENGHVHTRGAKHLGQP